MDDLMGMMQELLSDPESMKQIQELTQMLQSESGDSEDSAQSAQAETQGEQAEREGGGAGFWHAFQVAAVDASDCWRR